MCPEIRTARDHRPIACSRWVDPLRVGYWWVRLPQTSSTPVCGAIYAFIVYGSLRLFFRLVSRRNPLVLSWGSRVMTTFVEPLRDAKEKSRRLRHYLDHYFEEISAEWSGAGRRDLRSVLDAVLALGLVDDRGRPPSSQTLTRTWERVKKRRAIALTTKPQPHFTRLYEPSSADETSARSETTAHVLAAPAVCPLTTTQPADATAIAMAKLAAAAQGATGRGRR